MSRGNHRRLPPLNALRAFEAAARTGGFQAAGVELNVSANAVGRLVKVLEDSLGIELFKRLARGVAVTEVGRSYLERVEKLFDQLADATADLQRHSNANRLTISAGPSFVARWLVPRLGRLSERFPELDVALQTSALPVDFAREGVDVAIRHALEINDGLHRELLMHEDFFPVCSPELLAQGNLHRLSDLAHHVLLHYERPSVHPDQIDWPRWLASVGEGSVDVRRSLQFTFAHLVLQAAAAGQGVALASSALIADDVATGRLVKPFGDLSVRGPYRYFLVCPQQHSTRQKVAAFRAWALEEAATDGCGAGYPSLDSVN